MADEKEPLTVTVRKLVCAIESLNKSVNDLTLEVKDFKKLFIEEFEKLIKVTLGEAV